jgi:hypothetical protein
MMTDSTFDAFLAALRDAERGGLRVSLRISREAVRARVSGGGAECVLALAPEGVRADGDPALRDRLFGWMRSAQAGIDAGADPAPVRAIVWEPSWRIDWNAVAAMPVDTLRFALACESLGGGRTGVIRRIGEMIGWKR